MSTDVDEQVIQKTQKILEKYIKKPPLTEKLLRKPPFRFLHDIISNVIRETGFLKGLYSERELVSENVKNKDDKIAFLTKLIDATKSITGSELAVRPSKIIAGFEPTETNLLLQAIGNAIYNNLDSSRYIADLKNKKRIKTYNAAEKDKSKSKEKRISKSVTEKTKIPPSKSQSNKESPKPAVKPESMKDVKENVKSDKSKMKVQVQKTKNNEEMEAKEEAVQKSKNEEAEKPDHQDNVLNEILPSKLLNVEQTSAKLSRSDLVLDKPLELKPVNNVEPIEQPEVPEVRVKTEIAPLVVENHVDAPKFHPRSSVRPPSVRPSSARPGAPRLRNENALTENEEVLPFGKVNVILENFNNQEMDEEETVMIQTAPEVEYQPQLLQMPTDKGHLVEQILEQITDNTDAEYSKPTVNIEWEQDAFRDRNNTNKEVEQLKAAIQTLTRVANPLGKLINYLHEDVEAMHSELDMWNSSARQVLIEVGNQKRISDESNKPLQTKLEEIEESIIKHQQIIITIYGNVLRNEDRIRNLLMQ